MIDPIPLPYPLNLPDDWKYAALRAMSPDQRMAIGFEMSDEYRRRWLRSLRKFYPAANDAELRQVVIDTLLAQSEQENEIAERCRRREEAIESRLRAAAPGNVVHE